MRASASSTDSSNTISLIRFFNAVLLLVVPVGSNPACGAAPDSARPVSLHKFGRAALGPRVVGLSETHSLIKRRMIVEPEFHGCRGIRFFQVHLTQHLEGMRGHHRGVRYQAVYDFEAVLVGLMLQVAAKCI